MSELSKDTTARGDAEGLTRRGFIGLGAASAAAVAAGCATNPVTGERQFMMVSESQEIQLDQEAAPHQFSSDYGAVQDAALNAYVADVGGAMAPLTHRPHMPYNYRAVNSVVVNGYTFPGGSMALCRGLLLQLDNEAELAGVLGHELGHVNARHAAERMSKGLLVSLAVAGIAAYVEHEAEEYTELAAGLGAIGGNILLMRYSREDEREADALGMEYMTRANYNPAGMSGLMQTFMNLHDSKPNVVELLFSTHPMSDERFETAVEQARSRYAFASEFPEGRERYMDRTASLRTKRAAIEAMQAGEKAMMTKRYGEAEQHFQQALGREPNDYAGLLMMAKCCMAQNRAAAAEQFVARAKSVYPQEPQADHLTGMVSMARRRFGPALRAFETYEKRLPGNPNTVFFRGYCLESMGRRREAAGEYARYAQVASSGEFSAHARGRLVQWGYMQPPQQQQPQGGNGNRK